MWSRFSLYTYDYGTLKPVRVILRGVGERESNGG
jgi:hypothetical protein